MSHSDADRRNDRSGDYVTSSVPMEERKGFANIFSTVAGWIICLSTILTGGALASGLDFGEAFAATIIGMLILTVISAPLAALGGRFGVSSTMLTRPVFGRIGSVTFGLIIALLNGIGWFAFQAAFFALTMQQMFPNSIFSNLVLGSILGGFFMTLTAVFGYKGIAVLSFLAVPLITLLSLFGSVAAVEQGGGFAKLIASQAAGAKIDLFTGVSIVVGNAVLGSIVLSDISRYSKNAVSGAVSSSVGYLIGGVISITAGLAMAYVANVPGIGTTPNLPHVMVTLGLGLGALVILVLAQWTTNTANLYSASLGIGSFIKIPQKYTVMLMGIIATLLAVFNVYAMFIPFLIMLSSILPPIGGVMLADYYIIHRLVLKKEYVFGSGAKYAQLNWLAIAVAVISAFVTLRYIKFFTPAFMSLMIAFAGYSALAFVFIKLKTPYMIGEYTEE